MSEHTTEFANSEQDRFPLPTKRRRTFRDLAGRRFGKLVALRQAWITRRGETYWLCRCDCGNEKTVNGSKLIRGQVRSCACLRSKTINLLGRRFGRLVVTAFSGKGKVKNKARALWQCRCDCGGTSVVVSSNLLSGNTISCGCGHRKFPFGESNVRQVYIKYRKMAKANGREFSLSMGEARELFISPCLYCGSPPSNVSNTSDPAFPFRYSGIDRYDNSKGYVAGNVVSCCRICNIAKRDMSATEFINWIMSVYDNLDLDFFQ